MQRDSLEITKEKKVNETREKALKIAKEKVNEAREKADEYVNNKNYETLERAYDAYSDLLKNASSDTQLACGFYHYSFAEFVLQHQTELKIKEIEPRPQTKAIISLLNAAECKNSQAVDNLVTHWFSPKPSFIREKTNGDGFSSLTAYSLSDMDLQILAKKIATMENESEEEQTFYVDQALMFLRNEKGEIKTPRHRAYAYYLLVCYYLQSEFKLVNLEKGIICINALLDIVNELPTDPKYGDYLKDGLLKFIALKFLQIGEVYLQGKRPHEKNIKEAKKYFYLALKHDPKSLAIHDIFIHFYQEKYDGLEHINFSKLNRHFKEKFQCLRGFEKKADFIIYLKEYQIEIQKRFEAKEENEKNVSSLKICIQELLALLNEKLRRFYNEKKINKMDDHTLEEYKERITILFKKNLPELEHTLNFILSNFIRIEYLHLAKQSMTGSNLYYLEKASEQGSSEAKLTLAKYYTEVEPNLEKAIQLYEEVLKEKNSTPTQVLSAKKRLLKMASECTEDDEQRHTGKKAAKVLCDHACYNSDESIITQLYESAYPIATLTKGKWMMEQAKQGSIPGNRRQFCSSLFAKAPSKALGYLFEALKTADDDDVQMLAITNIFDFAGSPAGSKPNVKKKIENQLLTFLESHIDLASKIKEEKNLMELCPLLFSSNIQNFIAKLETDDKERQRIKKHHLKKDWTDLGKNSPPPENEPKKSPRQKV